MKKTFITLLALAGIANADITETQSYYYSWDTSSSPAGNSGVTWVEEGGNDGKGYITTTQNPEFYPDIFVTSNNFTMALKVRNLTMAAGDSAIFSYAPRSTEASNDWKQLAVRRTESGAITLDLHTDDGYQNLLTLDVNQISYADLQSETEWSSIILTGSSNGLTLNINGVSATYSGFTLSSDKNASDFQLASEKYRGNTATTGDFDDLAVWNRTLTDDEVAFLVAGNMANGNLKLATGNIPEPTTATLSLLALAGLAARRRRK